MELKPHERGPRIFIKHKGKRNTRKSNKRFMEKQNKCFFKRLKTGGFNLCTELITFCDISSYSKQS